MNLLVPSQKTTILFIRYNVSYVQVKYFILVVTHVLYWVLIHSIFAACLTIVFRIPAQIHAYLFVQLSACHALLNLSSEKVLNFKHVCSNPLSFLTCRSN
jgi:hypothetical protein